MEEQAAWRLRYLQARVVASERAEEVLALLRAAEDREAAVRGLASMLQVDDQAAGGVLDHWGTSLSLGGREEAEQALDDFQREVGST